MAATVVRSGYATTSPRGLDWDSIPMRLFQKSKALAWDPWAIDLTQDKADWQGMVDLQRISVLMTTTQFVGGEEAVTLDLLPLVMHVAEQGMVEEEIYLTAFLNEEAKHTEFFRRWLDEVTGSGQDLMQLAGPSWRRMFLEELPSAMNALKDDSSSAALARALTTYNIVVEGVLAETGYNYYRQLLEMQGTLGGLLEGIRHVSRDESRHLRFGIFMLQRLIAEDESVWGVIENRIEELRPLAVGVQVDGRAAYVSRATAELGEIPEDLMAIIDMMSADSQAFQERAFERRMSVLARAKGQSRKEIEAAQLEDDLEAAMAVSA